MWLLSNVNASFLSTYPVFYQSYAKLTSLLEIAYIYIDVKAVFYWVRGCTIKPFRIRPLLDYCHNLWFHIQFHYVVCQKRVGISLGSKEEDLKVPSRHCEPVFSRLTPLVTNG